jgi:hypothetical protein
LSDESKYQDKLGISLSRRNVFKAVGIFSAVGLTATAATKLLAQKVNGAA